jgi:hypothetical protein
MTLLCFLGDGIPTEVVHCTDGNGKR